MARERDSVEVSERSAGPAGADSADRERLATLDSIQQRVLWLATAIVHHANRVRPERLRGEGRRPPGLERLGGLDHDRAVVRHLRGARRGVGQAARVAGAARDQLPARPARRRPTSTQLREFGGLQSYPSRAKDPDAVDYSTGSVGIGATATIWGALAHRYLAGHFEVPVGGRHIALRRRRRARRGRGVGGALSTRSCRGSARCCGSSTSTASRSTASCRRSRADRLRPCSRRPGGTWSTSSTGAPARAVRAARRRGAAAADRRDAATRSTSACCAPTRPSCASGCRARARAGRRPAPASRIWTTTSCCWPRSATSAATTSPRCSRPRTRPTRSPTGPRSLFAYTIKGWGLPIAGPSGNHSALLTDEQLQRARRRARRRRRATRGRASTREPAEAELCAAAAERLRPGRGRAAPAPPAPPVELGRAHAGRVSTQQALGRFLVDLVRTTRPRSRARIVTVSPDVASSTNLGGWINRAGIWSPGDRIDWFADDTDTLVRWRETRHGQHIELGIAETNLVGLLGELGATWSRDGQPLLPIGTLYDPFVGRALEPWSFGIYAGGQSILVGTPSGVALGARGRRPPVDRHARGRARAARLRGLGAGVRAGLRVGVAGRARAARSRRRLLGLLPPLDHGRSTRRWPRCPTTRSARERRRRRARRRLPAPGGAAGSARGHDLRGRRDRSPRRSAAAEQLERGGRGRRRRLPHLPRPRLPRAAKRERGLADGARAVLDALSPRRARGADRHRASTVTRTRSPSSARSDGVPLPPSGSASFGQSGDLGDLYRHHGIDVETIVGAAADLIQG